MSPHILITFGLAAMLAHLELLAEPGGVAEAGGVAEGSLSASPSDDECEPMDRATPPSSPPSDDRHPDEPLGPEPLRIGVGLKTGWLNQTHAADLFTLNLDTDLRLKTWTSASGDHWIQLQLPQSYYRIATASGAVWVVDSRLRVEWGPSLGHWLPGFSVDVGWLAQSRDWAAALDNGPIHGFMVGGAVHFPIRRLQGVVHLKFGKSLTDPDYTRFSCGLRWYPWRHVGFHVHGDNFWRDMGSFTNKYSGFFAGVTTRW